MSRLKVMSIFGTRPEAIKMAPVVRALQAEPQIEALNVVTGQHREMLDQVLKLFEIQPHADLNIMQADQSLSGITRRTLEGLEKVLHEMRPDVVLVQGDTTTAFVSGLAAFYERVPVGHVEAGLRTFNRYDPFPEEINRRLLSQVADMHFAPTEGARANLLNSGIEPASVLTTGNTVTDALQEMVHRLPPGLPADLPLLAGGCMPPLQAGRQMLLVETHRRENLGAPMQEICEALRTLVTDFTNCEIVFSVHKNPRVREVVVPALQSVPKVWLVEPVDYPVLIRLMRESHLILTDSGGIQEEAPSLGKPVLVLRRTTERPEGIDSGVAMLVGTDREKIVGEAGRLLRDPQAYRAMSQVANPYGDGNASQRIVQALLHRFGRTASAPQDFRPVVGSTAG